MIDWTALIVFLFFFALVTALGFLAARWRQGDLNLLHEWGLGGRSFGTIIIWFLMGGDLYTAYTFIAVPALMYGAGAVGFFAVPYTVIAYPILLIFAPRLWAVCRQNNYVTPADFVKGRYGSKALELAIALTGILATMPYIALQLVGIQVVIQSMGLAGTGLLADLPLVIAFVILAAYTYTSGLRAPAMIAFVKDLMIFITVFAAIVILPAKLGGWAHIFSSAQTVLAARTPKPASIFLGPAGFSAYATLAFGSALALFLYPHSITGLLSSARANDIRRNATFLPAYSFMLALLSLLGFAAIASGITSKATSLVIPKLFIASFPSWFVGFAFAAIAIGALVPAAIMSIGAANLFTRNVYTRYINPNATDPDESRVAKITSLVVKLGALAFIIFIPLNFAIYLQLLGGVWILQTLPAIILGLWTRWFHGRALLAGWLAGMIAGTWMAASQNFTPAFPLHLGGLTINAYTGLWALALNLIVAAVLTYVFDAMKLPRQADSTKPQDYDDSEITGGGDVIGIPVEA